MQLYNTRTRKLETLKPLQDNTVRIYSCGPTVYDHTHIGNLSAYIFADTLRRAVQLTGAQVEHAMNYTDVDDKTIRRSRERYPNEKPRTALHKLTNEYIDLFLDDMTKIGNDVQALTFLRATDGKVISGMQAIITKLHQQGFAYIADDGVYFSIAAYRKSGKTYGQLLELTLANTSEERIQNDEYDKESAHDFALWKKQKDGEPAWPFTLDGHDLSGRPGWHIECSVMSRQALGQPFDIHTGGVDLIFPHHENEIAQSTAGEDNPVMAQIFAHNEHILVDGKKMAKSANNFYTLQNIIDKGFDPLAFRLLVLQAHYRSQVHFSWDNLAGAYLRLLDLEKFGQLQHQPNLIDKYGTVSAQDFKEHKKRLQAALDNDLNTPIFLSELSSIDTVVRREKLKDQSSLNGLKLLIEFVDEAFGLKLSDQPDLNQTQKDLVNKQDVAWRAAKDGSKDFTEADNLREILAEKHKVIISNYNDGGPLWARY